jgi:hypothetical protein
MAKAYWKALLEVNPGKLAVQIFDAETAILERMHYTRNAQRSKAR